MMNEDRYAISILEVREIVLEYLRKHDIVQYEYWHMQTCGNPDMVAYMVRDVLAGMQPAPVNDPEMYKRGLFE